MTGWYTVGVLHEDRTLFSCFNLSLLFINFFNCELPPTEKQPSGWFPLERISAGRSLMFFVHEILNALVPVSISLDSVSQRSCHLWMFNLPSLFRWGVTWSLFLNFHRGLPLQLRIHRMSESIVFLHSPQMMGQSFIWERTELITRNLELVSAY